MGSASARRLQLIIFVMLGAAAILVAGLMATGNLAPDRLVVGGDTRPGAGVPGRTADSVEAFTKAHGNPPDATYGRIRIPAISVDAPLTHRTVPKNAEAMPDPSGPTDVAYYDMSAWPGLGGKPGAGHNAIFAGHVDLRREIAYAGGVLYQGPAVFWLLEDLKAGDTIEVTVAGGTPLKYAVVSVKELSASAKTDWSTIWSGDVKKDTVTLFTCGGAFDAASHEYTTRVVVRAERVG